MLQGNVIRRYLTLSTDRVFTLPIAILMPYSGCDCRCVMCDIWKGSASPTRLRDEDVGELLRAFRVLRTRQVVLSGGEPLLDPDLFRLCGALRGQGLKITLLSTGLLLSRCARSVAEDTDEVIVSLDGSEEVHNAIRRIPDAFARLREGVAALKAARSTFRVTGRCVIQRLNYAEWTNIVTTARAIGLDQISFLAADLSSQAFNRTAVWGDRRRAQVQPHVDELPDLTASLDTLISEHTGDFASGFIAESPDSLRRIPAYYAATHGRGAFPPVRCTAPWVSAVVEADGTVRPCFFHAAHGSIRETRLVELLNNPEAVRFRRQLDVRTNPVCRRCVCTLDLRPAVFGRPLLSPQPR